MARAPEQWRIILVGGLAGLLGSIIDSLLGRMFLWFLIRRGESKCFTRTCKKTGHTT